MLQIIGVFPDVADEDGDETGNFQVLVLFRAADHQRLAPVSYTHLPACWLPVSSEDIAGVTAASMTAGEARAARTAVTAVSYTHLDVYKRQV